MTAAIEVRGLRKTYRTGMSGLKRVEALKGVDLTAQPGEIYGFLGPNGAGKSTTIKIITQLVHASGGTTKVFGVPLTTPQARQRVGFLPESPVFYDYLTGQEFLRYYGALGGLDSKRARVRADELLEKVGLGAAGKLQLRRYSKGMLQRAGIAQALMHDPDLIILDEPVSGLDPIGRREMRELMLELKARGKTVFFSTHIIQDVELVCDRVGFIIGGRMVREGTVAELMGEAAGETEVVFAGLPTARVEELFAKMGARELGTGVQVLVPQGTSVEEVLQRGMAAGASVVSVQRQRRALEDLFIQEIARQAPDEGPRARAKIASAGGEA